MTAFGKDRPGIVAEIAGIVYENQCNLEDSNMGRLADEFTLILLLSGQGDDLKKRLTQDFKRLEREKNITAFIRSLNYQRQDPEKPKNYHTIEVEGIDQAGIVYRVSRLLAERGINIDALSSKKKFSPNSGTAIYLMEIIVNIPDGISIGSLVEELETLAQDAQVDIDLT